MKRVFASILVFLLVFSSVSPQLVAASLPVRYDMRDPNGDSLYNDTLLTPIKNQGKNGVCWAFASIAALEAILKKNVGQDFDLSEDHMRFLLSNKTPSTDMKFIREPDDGGNDMQSAAYLTLHRGPVNEKSVPYTIGNEIPGNLDFLPEYNLKRVICIDNEMTKIKNAIIDYSGVISGIHADNNVPNNVQSQSYNPARSSYFYTGSEEVNHSILIVGWDDNFSKDNFNNTPKNNGAWIVRNSWGTDVGEGGYIYVSYEDNILLNSKAQFTCFDGLETAAKDEKLYYHDPFGKMGSQGINNTTSLYVANVFTKDNNYLEKVKSVMFFDAGFADRYEIYIRELDSSGILPETELLDNPDLVINSSFIGYNTIDLPTPVNLQMGKFAIIFKAIRNDIGKCYFGVETSIIDYATTSAKADESFIYDAGWEDIGKLKDINYNIRAITELSQSTTNPPITNVQSTPNISNKKPDTTDNIITVNDITSANIPWKIIITTFTIFVIYYVYKIRKRGR